MSTQNLTGELFYIIESFQAFSFEDENVFSDPEFSRIVRAISRLTEELQAYDYEDFEELRISTIEEMDARITLALERTQHLPPVRSNEVLRRLQLLRAFVHDQAHLPSQIFEARKNFDEHFEEMLGYDDFIGKLLSPAHIAEDELFKDSSLWFDLAQWGKATSGISSRARQIVFWIAVRIRKGEEVSERQQAAGVSILQEAERDGFERRDEVSSIDFPRKAISKIEEKNSQIRRQIEAIKDIQERFREAIKSMEEKLPKKRTAIMKISVRQKLLDSYNVNQIPMGELMEISPLSIIGYHVGKTNSLSREKRREILCDFLTLSIPSHFPDEYRKSWGMPSTDARRRKTISWIRYQAKMRRANSSKKYAVAIREWEEDADFIERLI